MQDLKDLKSRFFQKRFRCCEGENPANPIILHILIQTIRGIAGDRPPRYGIVRVSWQNGPLYRRARACPSPGLGLPNDRGGQAPALR